MSGGVSVIETPPLSQDTVCEVRMETGGHRGGWDVVVTHAIIRDGEPDWMESTFEYRSLADVGRFLAGLS